MIKLAESATEIEQCFTIMLQLRPHLKQNDFVPQVQKQMRKGYQLVYVSDSDSESDLVIGVAGFNIATSLAWSKYLYLADLIVRENQRSEGYGEILFTWLIQYAKDNNCQQFHLDSGVQRFAAHRFYLRQKMNISSHHFALEL